MQVSQRNRSFNGKDKPLGLSFDNEPYLITFNYSHSNSPNCQAQMEEGLTGVHG